MTGVHLRDKVPEYLTELQDLMIREMQLDFFLEEQGFKLIEESESFRRFKYGSGATHFALFASKMSAIELLAACTTIKLLDEQDVTISLFLNAARDFCQDDLETVDLIISSQESDSCAVQPRHLFEMQLEATFLCQTIPTHLATVDTGNALFAATFALISMNALRQQLEPGVNLNAVLLEGGHDPNLVPGRSVLSLSIKAHNKSLIKKTVIRIKKCLESASLMGKTDVVLNDLGLIGTPLKDNCYLSELFYKNISSLKEEFVITKSVSTSTYLGVLSQTIPTLMPVFKVPSGREARNLDYKETESNVFEISKTELSIAQGIVLSILDLVLNPDLLEKIKANHLRGSHGNDKLNPA